MNNRDLNLFFCLGMLMPLVLVGLTIRDYFDQGAYLLMLASTIFAVLLLLLARWFYNNSRKDNNNGGLKISLT